MDSSNRSLDSHELYFDAPIAKLTQDDAIVQTIAGGLGDRIEGDQVVNPIASLTRLHRLGK
jgi:hypothetical protein